MRIVSLLLIWLVGCSGAESRLDPPAVDPDAAGDAAMTAYDANGDGAVAGTELDKVPSLKNTLAAVDTDKDGRLTAAEVSSKLALYRDAKTAMIALAGLVTYNNAPLTDATVTLVPETFMGDAVKPASGVTDAAGLCSFSVAELPGTHAGFFRIEVSKKNPSGQELIPAKYNSQTELGGVIGPDSPLVVEGGSIVLKLSGK